MVRSGFPVVTKRTVYQKMPFFRKFIPASILLVVCAAVGALTRAQTLAEVCFAVADGGSRGGEQDKQAEDFLALINKVTGVESNVGFTGTFDVEALAFWPNSQTLYAVNGGVLVRLDWKTDGRFTAVGAGIGSVNGPLGIVSVTDVDGLAFDPTTSPPRLYGSVRRAAAGENDLLIRIDTNTGQRVANAFGAGLDYQVIENATSAGGAVCDDVDDLAFDPLDGALFAIQSDGGANDLLTKIDTTDGGVAVVGPLGVDDAEGLAFFIDGSLFVSTGKNSRDITQRNGLYDVDKTTGVASNRRSSTKEDIEGLSCFTANVSLIGDLIWRDDNRNGVQDGAETGLAGVTVRLLRGSDAAVLQTRVTGADGAFLFAAPSGSYRIEAEAPSGFSLSPVNADGNDARDSDLDPATGRTSAFTVGLNVNDTTWDGGMFCLPPVVTCPPNQVLECPAGTATNFTGVATATSPCGCGVTMTYEDSFAVSCGATGTITRRWTAFDQCGGSSFCDQMIRITDTTRPVLAGVPPDVTAACDAIPDAPRRHRHRRLRRFRHSGPFHLHHPRILSADLHPHPHLDRHRRLRKCPHGFADRHGPGPRRPGARRSPAGCHRGL
jgi:opacity protein-like surface antigen